MRTSTRRAVGAPRWIRARFPGRCDGCARPIAAKSEALYWPTRRRTYLYCDLPEHQGADTCGAQRWRRYVSETADERGHAPYLP